MIERTNARSLACDALPYRPDLIVADVSFISLAKVLPAVLALRGAGVRRLVMVKPQFEVGRERVGKGGVVRDPGAAARGARGVAPRRPALGRGGAGLRVLAGCRARRATGRRSRGWPRPGAPGAVADVEAAARAVEP